MPSKKERIADEIRDIRLGLNEINTARQPAIKLQIDSAVNMLKKYIIDKQTKLDKYICKLQEMTQDEVANGLLKTITFQLNTIGNKYAKLLKLEGETETSTELEEIVLEIQIGHELTDLLAELQIVEDILNTHIGE